MQKKNIRVVAAVIEEGGKYLITQRRASAVLPLLWEFPGGKVEAGESNEEALQRELLERLHVKSEVGALLCFVSHHYEKYSVDLHLYACSLKETRIEKSGVQDFRWVSSSEFERFEFTPADEASMNQLLGES